MEAVELKLMRVRRGLRQYQVAATVGIAPCRLSEIETGRRQPDPDLLERILAAIEVEAGAES
ncbi:unnamed protein product, partial [marine sediment metagenome]